MAVFNIPFPPLNKPISDQNGMITDEWSDWMRGMTNLTTNNFNQTGVHAPTLNTDEFNGEENGSIYYDKDTDTYKGIQDGDIKTFTTT